MRRTNLFFVKVPKEHRGTRTVGSRSGGFSSGYRGGILQIFRQQFLLVFLGLFLIAGLILGVIFIRNADYSLLKTLDFVFFSNVKARSALPVLSIFVASLAVITFFCFYYFVFYVDCPYGGPIVFRWLRYSVDLAWELQPDICMLPMDSKDFYFIWLLFYREHLFV